mmetsp:Transcript_584/g.1000  ORF Transcript_584/g.1000 Transcript_584/m.1000 type:complete len:244 (+) Transcript_584:195-926(+)
MAEASHAPCQQQREAVCVALHGLHAAQRVQEGQAARQAGGGLEVRGAVLQVPVRGTSMGHAEQRVRRRRRHGAASQVAAGQQQRLQVPPHQQRSQPGGVAQPLVQGQAHQVRSMGPEERVRLEAQVQRGRGGELGGVQHPQPASGRGGARGGGGEGHGSQRLQQRVMGAGPLRVPQEGCHREEIGFCAGEVALARHHQETVRKVAAGAQGRRVWGRRGVGIAVLVGGFQLGWLAIVDVGCIAS